MKVLKILSDQFRKTNSFARDSYENRAPQRFCKDRTSSRSHWGEINGNLYIDMRLVHGQTLYELLKNGPLEPERAVAIIQREKSWSARVEGQTTVSA